MLDKARERSLRVLQASITALPFPAESFDVVYSYKVLAHVEPIKEALAELARVTRRGGYMLLEFYNPLSLRYLVKVFKPASRISEMTTDEAVFTRYDALESVREYLPHDVKLVTLRGIRVVTPLSYVYTLPPLGKLFGRVERALADAPFFRRLGGFLVVVAQRS